MIIWAGLAGVSLLHPHAVRCSLILCGQPVRQLGLGQSCRTSACVWHLAGMTAASGQHGVRHPADQSGLLHRAAGFQNQPGWTGPMHKYSLWFLLLFANVSLAGA